MASIYRCVSRQSEVTSLSCLIVDWRRGPQRWRSTTVCYHESRYYMVSRVGGRGVQSCDEEMPGLFSTVLDVQRSVTPGLGTLRPDKVCNETIWHIDRLHLISGPMISR